MNTKPTSPDSPQPATEPATPGSASLTTQHSPHGATAGEISPVAQPEPSSFALLTSGQRIRQHAHRNTAEKQAVFLATLGRRGTVQAAAKAAHIDRRTAYTWRDTDPKFRQAWIDTEDDVADSIEETMVEKGREGSFLHGIAILRARRPALYRDNYNESARFTKNEVVVTLSLGPDDVAARVRATSEEAPPALPVSFTEDASTDQA